MEKDEEKRKQLEQDKNRMANTNMAQAFSQYNQQKQVTYQAVNQMVAPRFVAVQMPYSYGGMSFAAGGAGFYAQGGQSMGFSMRAPMMYGQP